MHTALHDEIYLQKMWECIEEKEKREREERKRREKEKEKREREREVKSEKQQAYIKRAGSDATQPALKLLQALVFVPN